MNNYLRICTFKIRIFHFVGPDVESSTFDEIRFEPIAQESHSYQAGQSL